MSKYGLGFDYYRAEIESFEIMYRDFEKKNLGSIPIYKSVAPHFLKKYENYRFIKKIFV